MAVEYNPNVKFATQRSEDDTVHKKTNQNCLIQQYVLAVSSWVVHGCNHMWVMSKSYRNDMNMVKTCSFKTSLKIMICSYTTDSPKHCGRFLRVGSLCEMFFCLFSLFYSVIFCFVLVSCININIVQVIQQQIESKH